MRLNNSGLLAAITAGVAVLISMSSVSLMWLPETNAIYEDQLGEYDWKQENIGMIEKSLPVQFNGRRHFVVSTARGVLACLDEMTGNLSWRVIIGSGSSILKLIATKGHIVTLTEHNLASDSILGGYSSGVVRAWSMESGSLVWDVSVGVSKHGMSKTQTNIYDLLYDSKRGTVEAIYGNALHLIHIQGQQLGQPVVWSWSPTAELEQQSVRAASPASPRVQAGKDNLVLGSLIIPTAFSQQRAHSSPAADAPTRVAVGCVVDAADGAETGGICSGATFVLKLSFSPPSSAVGTASASEHQLVRAVQVDIFAKLPAGLAIEAAALRGVVSSEDHLGYLPDDVLFAAKAFDVATASSEAVDGHCAVLALHTNRVQLLGLPTPSLADAAAISSVVESFVFADPIDSEIKPALSVCAQTQDAAQSACGFYNLQLRVTGQENDDGAGAAEGEGEGDNSWELVPVQAGAANCVAPSDTHSRDGGSLNGPNALIAVAVWERFPYFEGVASTLHCVMLAPVTRPAAAAPQNPRPGTKHKYGSWLGSLGLRSSAPKLHSGIAGVGDGIDTAGATVQSGQGVDVSLTAAELDLLLGADPHIAPVGVQHVAVTRVPAGTSSVAAGGNSSSPQAYRVLLVLKSGLTLLLDVAQQQRQQGGIVSMQWVRHEALAQALDAVLLDAHVPTEGTMGATDDAELLHRLLAEDRDDNAGEGGESGDDDDDVVLPGFRQRMALQGLKMKVQLTRYLSSLEQLLRSAGGPGAGQLEKLNAFGLGKTAVFLCVSDQLAGAMQAGTEGSVGAQGSVPFSESGLQLVAVDLLQALGHSSHAGGGSHSHHPAISWTTAPTLGLGLGDGTGGVETGADSHSAGFPKDPLVTFVKLLNSVAPARSGSGLSSANGAGAARVPVKTKAVSLVVGMKDGRTFVWTVDASTGLLRHQHSPHDVVLVPAALPRSQVVPWVARIVAPAPVASIAASASTTAWAQPSYVLMHLPPLGAAPDSILVSRLSAGGEGGSIEPAEGGGDGEYLHHIDRVTGQLTIYKVSNSACDGAEGIGKYEVTLRSDSHADSSGSGGGSGGGVLVQCVRASATATLQFSPQRERVVALSHLSAADVVNSKYSILGDDSVLLKYVNPHSVLIASLSTAGGGDGGGEGGGQGGVLYLTLVDAVAGRVVMRIKHEAAALPVHCVLIENHIIATYWNSKAKRSELSSLALYEAVIDAQELGPLATSRARASSAFQQQFLPQLQRRSGRRSAFSAAAPLVMQKSFALPRAGVSALHHTATAGGVANKHLLLALRNGQIFSVDLRQIHPRRPLTDPSKSEKEEGLARYSPFLVMNPLAALTHNYSLPGGGAARIISAPSGLESSSVVLSFGRGSDSTALDVHLNRAMPSQGFDLLASDFNHGLLLAIIFGLATTVLVLRQMQHKKKLSAVWA